VRLNYCNRTATGLVQASTQRTNAFREIAENPVNEPNNRTHQDALERTTSDCGTKEEVAGSSPVGHPPLGAMVLATIVVVVVAGPAQLSRKHHKQEEVDPMSLRCLRLLLVKSERASEDA
jgi:hypothetical protein